MEVIADLKVLQVFTADNRCTYKGCFYPEDEWDITVTAETLEDLRKKATEEIVKTRIEVTNPNYFVAEYLIYGGNEFRLKIIDDLNGREFWDEIKSSDYYKKLEAEKQAEQIRAQEEDAKTHDRERLIELEREQARLKEKLGMK